MQTLLFILFFIFLGIKNHIMKLLLSFNSLWLRIGLEVSIVYKCLFSFLFYIHDIFKALKKLGFSLEYDLYRSSFFLKVIFGEMILLHSNSDVQNLSRFITTRLLANPDIAAMYAHPTVPNYFKPGYEEALCKFALKKFLLLVSFLDHAKHKRLIDHDPCLFNVESPIKVCVTISFLYYFQILIQGE